MAAVDEPTCHGCSDELEKKNNSPRKLIRLPTAILGKEFKNKQTPIYLCSYCDSDELEGAFKLHMAEND